MTTSTDRKNGLIGTLGIKKAVVAATTAEITLSGEQTIDGVAVVTNDRVLVKNQSDTTTNGIYDVATSGWTRSLDFDGNQDVVNGTLVFVTSGSTNQNRIYQVVSPTDEVTIGTTAISFNYVISTGDFGLAASNNLSDVANAASSRANLGVTIGADVQAYNATLESLSGLSGSANQSIYFTATNTLALFDLNPLNPFGLVGAVMSFATSTAPTGWLECDGAAISRTTYSVLFGIIGTTFGPGDGSTTFNIPDMRGYFARGWAHSGSVDSGRSFGSTQQDAFQGHYHKWQYAAENLTGVGTSGDCKAGNSFTNNTQEAITDGLNGVPRTATETRPVNVALMFCIKY